MAPVDFQNFKFNKGQVDLFQPIETLDGQSECDFFLDKQAYIKKELKEELKLNQLSKSAFIPGII